MMKKYFHWNKSVTYGRFVIANFNHQILEYAIFHIRAIFYNVQSHLLIAHMKISNKKNFMDILITFNL